MSGYSGTPLPKKIGIAVNHRVVFINEPENFRGLLGNLPDGVEVLDRVKAPVNLIVFFATSEKDLLSRFEKLASMLDPAGMLWIAWPKKSSGVKSDLNDGRVRLIGLEAGLVDNKVCAIDDIWSGLRFVIRLKDRPLK